MSPAELIWSIKTKRLGSKHNPNTSNLNTHALPTGNTLKKIHPHENAPHLVFDVVTITTAAVTRRARLRTLNAKHHHRHESRANDT